MSGMRMGQGRLGAEMSLNYEKKSKISGTDGAHIIMPHFTRCAGFGLECEARRGGPAVFPPPQDKNSETLKIIQKSP